MENFLKFQIKNVFVSHQRAHLIFGYYGDFYYKFKKVIVFHNLASKMVQYVLHAILQSMKPHEMLQSVLSDGPDME